MTQSILFIVNDPPYGTERAYNAFRLAGALTKRDGIDIRVFLMGGAAATAMAGQKLPDGYYKLDRMPCWSRAPADRRSRSSPTGPSTRTP